MLRFNVSRRYLKIVTLRRLLLQDSMTRFHCHCSFHSKSSQKTVTLFNSRHDYCLLSNSTNCCDRSRVEIKSEKFSSGKRQERNIIFLKQRITNEKERIVRYTSQLIIQLCDTTNILLCRYVLISRINENTLVNAINSSTLLYFSRVNCLAI